jgi:predicted transcriptional regulator
MVQSSVKRPAKKLLSLMLMLTCFAMVESSLAVRSQAKTADTSADILPTLREQLEETIYKTPGIHFRDAIRATGRTVGVIQYHLNFLEKQESIISFENKNYKGYFPAAMRTLSEKFKIALIMFHTPQKHEILTYLLQNGETSQKTLAEATELSDQNLSYHLKVMEQMGLIHRCRSGLGKTLGLEPDVATFLSQFK